MSNVKIHIDVRTNRGELTLEREGRPTTAGGESREVLELLDEITEAVRRFYQEPTS